MNFQGTEEKEGRKNGKRKKRDWDTIPDRWTVIRYALKLARSLMRVAGEERDRLDRIASRLCPFAVARTTPFAAGPSFQ